MSSAYPFEAAFNWLLGPDIEGEHSNDAADRGGDTWYGISRNAHPDIPWPPSRDDAAEIYRAQYWEACDCDKLPANLAVLVFDSAVQHGGTRAIKLLQLTLGTTADGVFGPKTQAAAQYAPDAVVADFLSRRARLYTRLVLNDRQQLKFCRGWHRRLFLLQQLITTL